MLGDKICHIHALVVFRCRFCKILAIHSSRVWFWHMHLVEDLEKVSETGLRLRWWNSTGSTMRNAGTKLRSARETLTSARMKWRHCMKCYIRRRITMDWDVVHAPYSKVYLSLMRLQSLIYVFLVFYYSVYAVLFSACFSFEKLKD